MSSTANKKGGAHPRVTRVKRTPPPAQQPAAAADAATPPPVSASPPPASPAAMVDPARLPLEQSVTQLRGVHAKRSGQLRVDENAERARAKTPLALTLQVMGCQFAQVRWRDDATIPEYSWPDLRCYQGKDRPDQDCRECRYSMIMPYGGNLPPYQRRYMDHGLVIPIPDDAAADVVAQFLYDQGHTPLRRPAHELTALEQAITNAESRIAEIDRRAADEAQQRGQLR